jgi:hypothetical protein
MRLIALAAILGYLTWAIFNPQPLLVLSQDDVLHGLAALIGYLLVEGCVSLVKGSTKKAPQKTSENESILEGLKAEKLGLESQLAELQGLKDELKNSRETLNVFKEKLTHAEQALVETSNEVSTDKLNRQAITLLGLLQSKGRFVDFLMQDIARYDDAKVGGVARFVHAGCSKVLTDHFSIEPVHAGSEGQKIELKAAFDPQQYKLTGKVASSPPYSGKVVHKGWKSGPIRLPQPIENDDQEQDEFIIVPAEVECA